MVHTYGISAMMQELFRLKWYVRLYETVYKGGRGTEGTARGPERRPRPGLVPLPPREPYFATDLDHLHLLRTPKIHHDADKRLPVAMPAPDRA